ncbi:hypothetical protein C7449_105296 [Mycoplana dimorpha]|uniref:Uncharacterized protein n=1 Tax=Mycoplana dimorpha TaxID=28320 RepID=A0A2T5B5X9_MYCDI|nr:hypothetical protein C7449_105296 [Mycoplana dimorpha]
MPETRGAAAPLLRRAGLDPASKALKSLSAGVFRAADAARLDPGSSPG